MEPKKLTITVPRTGRTVEVLQKGEGRDVVFLHGAGGLPMWSADLESLAHSFRVTAPIFPGFGNSTGVDSIDGVLDSVLHTFDVLDQLGIVRPHLVGHSMGGMIAAEMAAICPNDVGRIVLVCPVGLWDEAHPVLDFFTLLPLEIVPYIFYDKNHPIAQAMSTTPTNEATLVDMYVNYIKGLSAAGRLLWPLPDRGLKSRIGRIKSPALVLWGEADGLAPVFYAHEFGRLIPDARVKIIQKASHMVLLEKPAEAAREITDFLKSSGNGAGGAMRKPAAPAKKAAAKAPSRGAPRAAARKSAAKKARGASKPAPKKAKKLAPKKKAKGAVKRR